MTGYTLGLSYGFHDAAAALVKNGKVVAFAAEERFSRQKHDRNFPKFAIEFCLGQAGLTVDDLDMVAYHEVPEQTFTRVLTSAISGFPNTSREFSTSMKAWLSGKLWARNEICGRLAIDPDKLECHQHHTSHAAQSFLSSGYSDAAILTIDAAGEWACTGMFAGDSTSAGTDIKSLKTFDFPNSLGLFYSTMTAYLGFVPMDGECSTMALAAFGQPVYAEKIRSIVRVDNAGYSLDQSFFHFAEFYKSPFTKKLTTLLGPARNHKIPLPFSCLTPFEADKESQRFADIAASVQLVYEEVVLNLVRQLRSLTKSANLCLAGGGALNCVAVRKILDQKIFNSVYIAPDPGDGGAAAGAALLSHQKRSPSTMATHAWVPWSGADVESEELDFIDEVETNHSRRYSRPDLLQPKHRLHQQTIPDSVELTAKVSKMLADGKIVGWCQGRFENGPRALGNRSILIRPDSIELATRLSNEVKNRAPYRPYALSLTAESAGQMLQNFDEALIPYRWMQLVDSVPVVVRPQVKSALHIDGTTRPQVVYSADSPLYHQLLTAYGKLSGVSALLNTSFNESGYPIVTTAIEAFAVFCRTTMDVLVVNNLVISKVWEDS